jgi:predicted nucleic acid-binding protein
VAVATWLIDTSAYARLNRSRDASLWLSRIERGLVRIAGVTALEVGYSFTRRDVALDEMTRGLLSFLVPDYLTPTIEERAKAVQLELLSRGSHRAVSVADLLVAATAEIYGRTVLHLDQDFDLIADVTGQSVEKLALSD